MFLLTELVLRPVWLFPYSSFSNLHQHYPNVRLQTRSGPDKKHLLSFCGKTEFGIKMMEMISWMQEVKNKEQTYLQFPSYKVIEHLFNILVIGIFLQLLPAPSATPFPPFTCRAPAPSAHGPVTWHAKALVYFHGDPFSGALCQRQYYAGNIQVLTVKISDGQINQRCPALARPNRAEIVRERLAANESHQGEAAQSLIITPPFFHFTPSIYPPVLFLQVQVISRHLAHLSYPPLIFNVTFISRRFPWPGHQGGSFIHSPEPLNSLLCADL